MEEVRVQTLEAELDIDGLLDYGAMAEAVNDALGGSYGYGEPVRWPHDCWVELAPTPMRFITVVAAEAAEMDEALCQIEDVLRRDSRWRVLAVNRRAVSQFESEVAMELARLPRL
jgi:hypothetical protein